MKLELKHLAPYLPYGLIYKRRKGGVEFELSPINITHVLNSPDSVDILLRPLSDFGGSKKGGEVMSELDCSINCVYEIWVFDNKDKSLEEISYETILVMCKNHIDFQGLIEAGLAIKKENK